jgi:hypothetical protein
VAGERAPDYLIFQLLGFGGRIPALEDGQALLEIFQRYHPVLAEGANLLLQRNQATGESHDPQWKPIRNQIVRFNEEVAIGDLPDTFELAKVHLAYSWAGMARKALFRPPPVFLKLRMANQQILTYRLIPAIAANGFLLNPWLQETGDVVDLYGACPGKRVIAFWVTADQEARRSFEKSIRITIDAAPQLPNVALEENDRKRLRYPMMITPPDEVYSSVMFPAVRCGDRLILPVVPDSEMRFRVAPGERHIRGQFGILPLAYEQGSTDGVRFTIECLASAGNPPTVLWERSLDPRQQPADRGFQELNVHLRVPADGQMIFRTSARPGMTTEWGFSFWTGVQID